MKLNHHLKVVLYNYISTYLCVLLCECRANFATECKCFVHPIFCFLFLVTFGDEVTKNTKILHNLCLHFARQDGQDRKKNLKKNHATKVTKIPKTK